MTVDRKNRPTHYNFTPLRFQKRFPNDSACLNWLVRELYPDGIFCEVCQEITNHHRVAGRRSYSCAHCGHHVHPAAGTIFEGSHAPLTTWFHVIYLLTASEGKISAKQIQRETGVTYKTAWRMLRLIRHMLKAEETKAASG